MGWGEVMANGEGGACCLTETAGSGVDSLVTLNSFLRYDLKETLNLFFGDENEENIFLNSILNHKYLDVKMFISEFKTKYNLFLSLNICIYILYNIYIYYIYI